MIRRNPVAGRGRGVMADLARPFGSPWSGPLVYLMHLEPAAYHPPSSRRRDLPTRADLGELILPPLAGSVSTSLLCTWFWGPGPP